MLHTIAAAATAGRDCRSGWRRGAARHRHPHERVAPFLSRCEYPCLSLTAHRREGAIT